MRAGLKGRFQEERHHDDHRLLDATRLVPTIVDAGIGSRQAPSLAALNETLRDDYIADCQKGIERWNRSLAEVGLSLRLPHLGFNRSVGAFAGHRISPEGSVLTESEWDAASPSWLPSRSDRAFVVSLMQSVHEPGRMASWIAPPTTGIHQQPIEFAYVRL